VKADRSEREPGATVFHPSKRLGQNFLVDPNLARKLVEALGVEPGETILEIGPGEGVLTDRLLAAGAHVHAIEKDRRLADGLGQRFAGHERFHLHVGDALEVEPDFAATGLPTRLISNLPYSVTTPLLLRIVFWGLPLKRIVVTVQREVARRIVAREGKEYGRLSILLALYGKARILFDLSPQAFRPRPSVVSSALALEPDASRPAPQRGSVVERVVKAAFAERRKQMAKLLASSLGLTRARVDAVLAACGVAAQARAEEVSPEAFLRLATALQECVDASPEEEGGGGG
jgi:16S rRNA (adenine1518-N6/adenine1519-N6)-dimethyltransferase